MSNWVCKKWKWPEKLEIVQIVQCYFGGSGGRMRHELCRGYINIGKQRKARQRLASGLVKRDLAHLEKCTVSRRDFI